MTKELKAVSFDFDATLYNYPRMVMRLIHRYGIHTKLIRDLTKGRALVRKEGHQKDFRERQVQVMAEMWGKSEDWTREKLDRVVYNGFNSHFDNIKPEKDAFKVLDMLVANGIAISVLSDYPPHDKMEKMGFMKYPWKTIINCEEIGLLKPHPKGFQLAMDAMGSKPENTLHVGDSLRYDVQGANELGMYSAWFKRWWRKPKPGITPDYTFKNMKGLMNLLEKEFGLAPL